MNSYSEKGLLPAGLADMLPPAAAAEAEVSENLMRVFKLNGYRRVKPPLIEFEEHLLEGAGEALAAKMFRVMDPVSHRMMGIRTDITPQVSRIATTRLKQDARPLRLSYSGQVLRVYGGQLRPERQFTQAGVELIGSSEISADAELILLAAEALDTLGIKGFSIDLTLPTLLPTICEEMGIEKEQADAARDALDQKDAAVLSTFGETLSPVLGALLEAAGPADRALDRLEALTLPSNAAEQVSQLRELVTLLQAAMPSLILTIDPGEYRGFEYQTGISFTLFAKNVRGELGRGGRYHLLDGECATGFTLFLDSLLRAVPRKKAEIKVFLPKGTSRQQALELRESGWITIVGLEDVEDEERAAKKFGCTHVFISGDVKEIA
ncbi:ATP phosphoribosyltransferase regulatory subunit [Sneathiella sp. P13V-1]|uniref:ATP phosphoribosyltransferase regulatory subunit n=1 Tax=Sneathiella sp. P13V-1 TaxID=2697366 RepID=UPI00187BC06E|nr:ATP phosphoribosyltransferase regulatory subunit [Sneathiella sp. P13V-1]MBE7637954.1 ATP phosphoribosyltransferase regulatory subunit [Sneathiella sp. P13V-1]